MCWRAGSCTNKSVGHFFVTCGICVCCCCRITGCLCSLSVWWVRGCWQCKLLGSKGSRVQAKWSESPSCASTLTVQALPSRFTIMSLNYQCSWRGYTLTMLELYQIWVCEQCVFVSKIHQRLFVNTAHGGYHGTSSLLMLKLINYWLQTPSLSKWLAIKFNNYQVCRGLFYCHWVAERK